MLKLYSRVSLDKVRNSPHVFVTKVGEQIFSDALLMTATVKLQLASEPLLTIKGECVPDLQPCLTHFSFVLHIQFTNCPPVDIIIGLVRCLNQGGYRNYDPKTVSKKPGHGKAETHRERGTGHPEREMTTLSIKTKYLWQFEPPHTPANT